MRGLEFFLSFHLPVSTPVFSPLLPVCFCFLNFLYAVCPCNKDYMHLSPLHQNSFWGTFLVAQWIRLCVLNAGGLGLIPGQGTRSHKPQLRVCMLKKDQMQPNKLINLKKNSFFLCPVIQASCT